VVLEIQGQDAKGKVVRSACLVENTLLLSADPSHRNAWRASQALLDPDSTPEQADLAAIFSLATYVLDGNLIRLPERKQVPDDPSAKKEIDNTPVGIAVWPPQPDGHELHRRIDPTMLGQLQWFQKILQAFFLNPSTKDARHETHHGHVNHSGDDDDDYEKEDAVDRLKEADENLKQAIKMWEYAYRDYQRLRDKLFELCPTAVNAPNIWPAIVFAFLSIMATFRKAKRLAPDFPKHAGIDPGMMCDDFFRAMFNYRQQHEDFCCPKNFRYRGEKFPPLAEDLHRVFKVHLHDQIICVILALAFDRGMRSDIFKNSPALTRDQLEIVCGQAFVPDTVARDTCRQMWRRHICYKLETTADAEFDKQFNLLFKLNPDKPHV